MTRCPLAVEVVLNHSHRCEDSENYSCRDSISAVTAVFTDVTAENTDETAVTNTAANSVKFSAHRSKISFNAILVQEHLL